MNQFDSLQSNLEMSHLFNRESHANQEVMDTPFFEQPIPYISIFDDKPKTQNAFQSFNYQSEIKQKGFISQLQMHEKEKPDQEIIHYHPDINLNQKISNFHQLQLPRNQRMMEKESLPFNDQQIEKQIKPKQNFQKRETDSKQIQASMKDISNQSSHFSLFKISFNNKNHIEDEKYLMNKVERVSRLQTPILKLSKIPQQKIKYNLQRSTFSKSTQNSNFLTADISNQNKSSNIFKNSSVEDKLGNRITFNLKSSRVLENINSKAHREGIQKINVIEFSNNNYTNIASKNIFTNLFVPNQAQSTKLQKIANQQMQKPEVSNINEIKYNKNPLKIEENQLINKNKASILKKMLAENTNAVSTSTFQNKAINMKTSNIEVFHQNKIEGNLLIIQQKMSEASNKTNVNSKQKLNQIQSFQIVKDNSKESIPESLRLKARLKNVGLRQTQKLQLKSIINSKGFMLGDKLRFGKPDSKLSNRLTNVHEKEKKQKLINPIIQEMQSKAVQINNQQTNVSLQSKMQQLGFQNQKQFDMTSRSHKQSQFSKLMMQVLSVMQQTEKLRQKSYSTKYTYHQLIILSNNLQTKVNQKTQDRNK